VDEAFSIAMAGNAQNGQFMFVEYAKPVETVKGQKKRRGGPSEVRAVSETRDWSHQVATFGCYNGENGQLMRTIQHITKNYHRALRVKRLQSLKKGSGTSTDDHLQPFDLERSDSFDGNDEGAFDEIEFADPELQPTSLPPQTPRYPGATRASPAAESGSLPNTAYRSPYLESGSSPHQDFALHRPENRRNDSEDDTEPTLLKILSASRIDPFDVLPVKNLPRFCQRVLDHAIVYSWPTTVPLRRAQNATNPVKSSWLHLAMEHPVVFHAFLYATSYHLLCAYDGREISDGAAMLRLSHKIETIKLVNEQLKRLGREEKQTRTGQRRVEDGGEDDDEVGREDRTDALIMAVATLSIHNQRDEVSCRPVSWYWRQTMPKGSPD
jgi:hypothetical protein